ncbi:DUF1819 family protein [Desulfobacula toluolica]|uniref:Conserved uncharacterized protein, DUF1819 n=1 Tax=Desulfobacula toluolica (strain DSM 7467 / Tol2) TaxID=651182 RepID=K0NJI7_DESTT|nr:DUF1819 family protein [Desulfobacula toluolica]CCK81025.1 conserved uncharacterized protein, DUF1819 [Desulfobacula toluolica Tol2]
MGLHNKNGSLPKYRMSFTVGGLFYQESVSAAELYLKIKDWAKVREKILKTNLFQARTSNSLERICREVLSRLKNLSSEQLKIIHDGSRQEQLQILWISVCKRYDFIRDFAVEVIREKFLLMNYSITDEDYTIFFDTKAEWHKNLGKLKDSTKKKLKQVLFRILRQAEITSERNIILPAILTKRVARALFTDKSGIYLVLPVSDTDFKEFIK